MRNLYIVTLEKLDKRYTTQFYAQWKEHFSKDFNVIYIDGTHVEDVIKRGRFLDINRTNKWKAQQVEGIADMFDREEVQNGDSFLFMDGWHFGVTALKYMAQLQGIDVKIYNYMHAGTWDSADFLAQAGLGVWAKDNELAWFKAADGNFVANYFHKLLILDYFNKSYSELEHKIHVVGFPMDWLRTINENTVSNTPVEKENLIIFPHRLAPEKQPEVFEQIKMKFPEYNFVRTQDTPRTKSEYYDLMRRAKIIFSANLQETYGIAVAEGVILGCVPIVPDRLSYHEMYSDEFKYKTYEQSCAAIQYFMSHYDDVSTQELIQKNRTKTLKDSLDAFSKMAEVIKNG